MADTLNDAAAHFNRANALFARQQFTEAIDSYRRALAINPNLVAVHYNLGNAYFRQANFADASACYLSALRLDPQHVDALYNLALAYCHSGYMAEAETCFRQVLRFNPRHVKAISNLGNTLLKQEKFREAVSSFQEALAIDPDVPEILVNLANCYAVLGELEPAAATYRRALHKRPDYADAANNLGKVLKEQGMLQEAVAQFRHTLELQPGHAQAYNNLSELIAAGFQFSTDDVAKITRLLASGRCSDQDAILHYFTLATIAHRQGAYEQAFQYYRQANDLRRRQLQKSGMAFDKEAHRAAVDGIIEFYDEAYFRRVDGWGLATERPIFIVGMPRSGSTLVEQILASHPEVHGAGELGAIPCFSSQRARVASRGVATAFRLADQCAAMELATAYHEFVTRLAGNAQRVTDKTLDNLLHLGLIATLFPHARVVHCRRHALDTCLACYFQDFRKLNFTFALEDIGSYYVSYKRLMVHWRRVLPLTIHEVRYESLVQDQVAVTRDLLDYCGLNWDDRCLNFFETRRVVQTASSVQVRLPLFSEAIGRWRSYRAHLGPLVDTLVGRPVS